MLETWIPASHVKNKDFFKPIQPEYKLDNGMGTVTEYSASVLKPKEQLSNKDWEIECVTCYGYNYWLQKDGKYKSGLFEKHRDLQSVLNEGAIHSVRRLSDGEVFSVGDKIAHSEYKEGLVIIRFEVKDDNIHIYTEKDKVFILRWCKKLPTPPTSTKPPLGIIPEWLWKKTRYNELTQAIQRYKDAFKEIPQEWINEQHDLRNSITVYEANKIFPPSPEQPKQEQIEVDISEEFFGSTLHKRDDKGWFNEYRVKIYNDDMCKSKDKSTAIKYLIEQLLNNNFTAHSDMSYSVNSMGQKLYTEKELLEARHDAFSDGYFKGWYNVCFDNDKTMSKKITDEKFNQYMNSLNSQTQSK